MADFDLDREKLRPFYARIKRPSGVTERAEVLMIETDRETFGVGRYRDEQLPYLHDAEIVDPACHSRPGPLYVNAFVFHHLPQEEVRRTSIRPVIAVTLVTGECLDLPLAEGTTISFFRGKPPIPDPLLEDAAGAARPAARLDISTRRSQTGYSDAAGVPYEGKPLMATIKNDGSMPVTKELAFLYSENTVYAVGMKAKTYADSRLTNVEFRQMDGLLIAIGNISHDDRFLDGSFIKTSPITQFIFADGTTEPRRAARDQRVDVAYETAASPDFLPKPPASGPKPRP